jgi:hypothetical protein
LTFLLALSVMVVLRHSTSAASAAPTVAMAETLQDCSANGTKSVDAGCRAMM